MVNEKQWYANINGVYKRINLDQILYFYADKKKVCVRTVSNTFPIKVSSLNSISDQLSDSSFARIHRGYLVNINQIESFNLREESIHIRGTMLPIGKTYKKDMLKKMLLLK